MPRNDPEYMREYQRRRRRQTKEIPEHNFSGSRPNPYAEAPKISPGKFHQHYWLRRLGEETATCTTFEKVIGCGETRPYRGKLLNTHTDGLPAWSEIIARLPTRAQDRLLERISGKQTRRST